MNDSTNFVRFYVYKKKKKQTGMLRTCKSNLPIKPQQDDRLENKKTIKNLFKMSTAIYVSGAATVFIFPVIRIIIENHKLHRGNVYREVKAELPGC